MSKVKDYFEDLSEEQSNTKLIQSVDEALEEIYQDKESYREEIKLLRDDVNRILRFLRLP